jgi:hypothetical protein
MSLRAGRCMCCVLQAAGCLFIVCCRSAAACATDWVWSKGGAARGRGSCSYCEQCSMVFVPHHMACRTQNEEKTFIGFNHVNVHTLAGLNHTLVPERLKSGGTHGVSDDRDKADQASPKARTQIRSPDTKSPRYRPLPPPSRCCVRGHQHNVTCTVLHALPLLSPLPAALLPSHLSLFTRPSPLLIEPRPIGFASHRTLRPLVAEASCSVAP